jgi:uncharacterized membrane protein (DUF106 family)
MALEFLTNTIAAYPKISLIVLSLVVTFLSSLITKYLTNQEHLLGLKKRQKELQEEMKKHKGDQKKVMELQQEALSISMTMMKSSFKPLLVTFIPFLILLYWLRAEFTPLIGGSWIWYYIGASLISSFAFRKILKMA